jgi:integrase
VQYLAEGFQRFRRMAIRAGASRPAGCAGLVARREADHPQAGRLLAFKPRTFADRRISTLDCTILDTGCRIQEPLSALAQDFDLDNQLLTVNDKGNKERKVPFGFELRKLLVRYEKVRDRVGCEQMQARPVPSPETRAGRDRSTPELTWVDHVRSG